MAQGTQPLNGLAKRLVMEGVFTADLATDALYKSREAKVPFVTYLIKQRLLSAHRVASAASEEFGLPLFDLDSLAVDTLPKDLISKEMIEKHHLLPLMKRGNRLYIALTDPTYTQGIDEIKFQTGLVIENIIVEEDKLTHLLSNIIDQQSQTELAGMNDVELDSLELEDNKPPEKEEFETAESVASEAPIVRFINKVLLDSVNKGASDIHFEPYEKTYRVRSRIDGILQEIHRPPMNLATRLASRLKVMSSMDISEKRIPQDGRIKLKLSSNRSIDFRVNSLPTLWGEKIVLRLLDPATAKIGIEGLGFEPDQREIFLNAIFQPQGMVLVTGPTGSGKTVTLYTGLNLLNSAERNISTAEDPVEINMEGINQVHVNTKVGLTFAEALRAFLRQDPDVVMVGEIRDLETAEIAIKAAQTGHMVLSTLHTNSAPETLNRLLNMGVPAFNVATSVNLIIAQRLARRLCESCKRPSKIPPIILEQEGLSQNRFNQLDLFEANPDGCNRCNHGYKGRVGIYEMLVLDDEIAQCIMNQGNSLDILQMARKQGFKTLREAGLLKVAQGITSLEEVNRIIKV